MVGIAMDGRVQYHVLSCFLSLVEAVARLQASRACATNSTYHKLVPLMKADPHCRGVWGGGQFVPALSA
jgi:hypothetical protein